MEKHKIQPHKCGCLGGYCFSCPFAKKPGKKEKPETNNKKKPREPDVRVWHPEENTK